MIISDWKFTSVSMLHHHSQKPDDDLGAWPDKDLVLVFLFSIVSALENTERWWKEFSLNFSIGGSCAYSSFVNLLRSFIKQERVIYVLVILLLLLSHFSRV